MIVLLDTANPSPMYASCTDDNDPDCEVSGAIAFKTRMPIADKSTIRILVYPSKSAYGESADLPKVEPHQDLATTATFWFRLPNGASSFRLRLEGSGEYSVAPQLAQISDDNFGESIEDKNAIRVKNTIDVYYDEMLRLKEIKPASKHYEDNMERLPKDEQSLLEQIGDLVALRDFGILVDDSRASEPIDSAVIKERYHHPFYLLKGVAERYLALAEYKKLGGDSSADTYYVRSGRYFIESTKYLLSLSSTSSPNNVESMKKRSLGSAFDCILKGVGSTELRVVQARLLDARHESLNELFQSLIDTFSRYQNVALDPTDTSRALETLKEELH